jgi:hypothetical protein
MALLELGGDGLPLPGEFLEFIVETAEVGLQPLALLDEPAALLADVGAMTAMRINVT